VQPQFGGRYKLKLEIAALVFDAKSQSRKGNAKKTNGGKTLKDSPVRATRGREFSPGRLRTEVFDIKKVTAGLRCVD
jgi:hypothetical protein